MCLVKSQLITRTYHLRLTCMSFQDPASHACACPWANWNCVGPNKQIEQSTNGCIFIQTMDSIFVARAMHNLPACSSLGLLPPSEHHFPLDSRRDLHCHCQMILCGSKTFLLEKRIGYKRKVRQLTLLFMMIDFFFCRYKYVEIYVPYHTIGL